MLSVIVPVYNVEEYLKQCVDSILQQDYELVELILVDDGSTDQSGNICDEYARCDSRVKVIHQENQGHTAARQNGFHRSCGEYVIFIDSDDWIDEGMFLLMMEKAVKENADIVQCNYRSVRNGIHRDEVPFFREGIYDKKALEIEIYPRMIYAGGYYRFGIAPNMWNKIFKRSLVEKFLPNIEKRVKSGEDGLLTFACFLEAERVYILNSCFYNYRSREVSMCRITDDKRLVENHLLFQCYQRNFMQYSFLQDQIRHYVVYQTLQAVAELLETRSLWKIKKEYTFLISDSIERDSIKKIKLAEIHGKKNKLILIGLKI
ncbi:hypothetical protein C819_03027 [Lachnospiraceae bacterium 10-1]|nr:hypothetical protein C819_03027 [Lachnospiraceae bacterium 10-1]